MLTIKRFLIAIALIIIIWLLGQGISNSSSPLPASNQSVAIVLSIDGVITPATEEYIRAGVKLAEKDQAKLILLKLNTPGGLASAMQSINHLIMHTPIPVVVYVTPSGGRAASAGTFIAYAANLSAMAPGTHIGAASPVDILATSPSNPQTLSTEEKKTINDTAAYIKGLAELRHRNVGWGESAVRQSLSTSADEAKRLQVVDIIANNMQDLLQQLNGKSVTTEGHTIKLDTTNLQLIDVPPDWRFKLLGFITNPNIAYLLLLVALYGLFFEIANPGLIAPGVIGVIALLLVLYAFQIMPVNYAGLTLILVGVVFLLCEVYFTSFGVLGIGGIVAFIAGSILLFDFNDPHYQLTWPLIILMCILTATFFFVLLNLAIRSHKRAIVTGREGLIGQVGTVLNMMNEQIVVQISGEIWEARSQTSLHRGQQVKVMRVDGLTLTVIPLEALNQPRK